MNHEDLTETPNNPAYVIHDRSMHPADVVRDPHLSIEEKRALLAAWASDAHAVPDEPTLRQLDKGPVVSLRAIIEALKALDALPGGKPQACADRGQRHNEILTKWRKRPPWRRRRRDDDEPPPVPAAVAARGPCPSSA